MAITLTDRPDIHLFQPGQQMLDPYPIGIWKACRVQPGDASAGQFSWTVAPASAAEAAKYLWSWENASIMTSTTPVASYWVYFQLVTGERYWDSTPTSTTILFAQAGQLANVTTRTANGYDIMPLFKNGLIHQPGNGLTNSYLIETSNINGTTFTCAAWGFLWNSEARRLAGGPRRTT